MPFGTTFSQRLQLEVLVEECGFETILSELAAIAQRQELRATSDALHDALREIQRRTRALSLG